MSVLGNFKGRVMLRKSFSVCTHTGAHTTSLLGQNMATEALTNTPTESGLGVGKRVVFRSLYKVVFNQLLTSTGTDIYKSNF